MLNRNELSRAWVLYTNTHWNNPILFYYLSLGASVWISLFVIIETSAVPVKETSGVVFE